MVVQNGKQARLSTCKSPFSFYVSPRRGSLRWCSIYATSRLLQVSFLVFTFQAGILIRWVRRWTTAPAEGPRLGMHSVRDSAQSKQKVTLTHAILLCHFMAVSCFSPSYLLLLITYVFLPSVVNKVQSNLLSKCGFLSLQPQGNVGNCEFVGWWERSDQGRRNKPMAGT